MRRFARGVLAPYISACGYRRLCEIGSHEGLSIDQLLQAGSVDVEIIDPCIDTDLERKYEDNPHILVRKGRSLEVLPAVCGRVDCIMIDGDHNWYTVYQELKLIHERSLLGTRGHDLLARCLLAICAARYVLRPRDHSSRVPTANGAEGHPAWRFCPKLGSQDGQECGILECPAGRR